MCQRLAKGGKRVLKEAMTSAEMAASELYPKEKEDELEGIIKILVDLGGSIR